MNIPIEYSQQDKIQEKLNEIYDSYFLNESKRKIIDQIIKNKVFNPQITGYERIRGQILGKINNRRIISDHEAQKGCPDVMPGLSVKPIWTTNDAPLKYLNEVIKLIPNMKNEVIELQQIENYSGFQPYKGIGDNNQSPSLQKGIDSTESGSWNVQYLQLHNVDFSLNREKCPFIVQVINEQFMNHYDHAFISIINPGTHISKHNGPTNKKLRVHIPLFNFEGCFISVAGQKLYQQENQIIIFDDSFEHQAECPESNKCSRVILIVDIWHPELTYNEINFMKYLVNNRIRAEQYIESDYDSYYQIIKHNQSLGINKEFWILNEEFNQKQKNKQLDETKQTVKND